MGETIHHNLQPLVTGFHHPECSWEPINHDIQTLTLNDSGVLQFGLKETDPQLLSDSDDSDKRIASDIQEAFLDQRNTVIVVEDGRNTVGYARV